MFYELRLSTGWEGSEQRLDGWSISLWPSLGKVITAYEVKTSRSDFLREIRQPQKREAGLKRSNQFFFATTRGVVKDESEIPTECGWMLFENGALKTMKEAPFRECAGPDWPLVRAICRRAFDSEVIAMRRKMEAVCADHRDGRDAHRVVDAVSEWLLEENKAGNLEMVSKLKKLLEPTGLYQWVGEPHESTTTQIALELNHG